MFWLSVEQGARAAGKQYHATILWSGPPQETDYTRQIEIVDSMIARHVDGLAVAAADRQILNASLERAAAEHIPVTVFDSGVDSDKYMTFVATDNYAAGGMAARKLGELLGGKGKVGVMGHAPGSFSTMDRERGFADTLKKEFPGVTVVATQFGMADPAKAMAAAENMLTAHPDLAGMFASSEPSSVGVARAIRARGLAGKVKFVAFDSSEGLQADRKAGVIQALVVQDPYKIGFEAVRSLCVKLDGGQPPKRMDLSARVE
ncbi:MAG: substrate-binding domain-containing protein [Acidobacteriota bacterium]|nr:substrate-binding domain-containing protein [Acidobacteriota bacterium]